jgi:hypothetical protein
MSVFKTGLENQSVNRTCIPASKFKPNSELSWAEKAVQYRDGMVNGGKVQGRNGKRNKWKISELKVAKCKMTHF